MFPQFTRTYDSGFTRLVQDPTGILENTPDAEVVKLFAELTSGTTVSSNWAYVRRVVSCATRLFGHDVRDWFQSQERNNKLSDHSREFLNETVAFINTGVRPVSIGARLRVLARERQIAQQPTGTLAIQPISDLATHAITQWLRREDGIVDLVFTLNLLFGKALSPQ